jgi:hypothetical protein
VSNYLAILKDVAQLIRLFEEELLNVYGDPKEVMQLHQRANGIQDTNSMIRVHDPRVAQYHIKAIELLYISIDLNSTAFSPVRLSLFARLCLESIDCWDDRWWSYLSNKILDNCIFSGKSSVLNLAIDSAGS